MPLAVSPSRRLAALLALARVFTGAPLRAQVVDSTGIPPAGLGTLRQDDIAIRLATPRLQIRVLPLDERIIRLMAPDTYRSLQQLRQTRAADIEQAATRQGVRQPTPFLVTFFGRERGARFTPEALTISGQNRFFRPAAIIPLSSQWSSLELNQRETVNAIYLYEDGILLLEPFTVTYDGTSSEGWGQTLRVLERERARVYARAGSGAQPGRP